LKVDAGADVGEVGERSGGEIVDAAILLGE
jgi:hypothetical protein